MTPTRLAIVFYEARERLAPHFGFDYNQGTIAFNALSPAGRFLIAVCEEVLDRMDVPIDLNIYNHEMGDFDE